jgi:hypothetical protein
LLRGSFFIPIVGQAKGKEKIRDADEDVADGDKENSGEVVNAQKDQRPAPKKSVNGEYAKVVPFAVRSVLQSSRCRFGTPHLANLAGRLPIVRALDASVQGNHEEEGPAELLRGLQR